MPPCAPRASSGEAYSSSPTSTAKSDGGSASRAMVSASMPPTACLIPTTPADVLPRHIGHEQAGVAPVRALSARLKVPLEHRDLAVIACREHLNVHRLDGMRDATVHDLLLRCDAFRKPERIARLALVCEADRRGRLGSADADYPQGALLRRVHAAACAVNARDLAVEGLAGTQIGEALRKARIRAIADARADARADRARASNAGGRPAASPLHPQPAVSTSTSSASSSAVTRMRSSPLIAAPSRASSATPSTSTRPFAGTRSP